MDPHQIEKTFMLLLSSIKTAVPDMYLGNVPELVAVWEFTVATETLCEHFADQYGGICPRGVYSDLMAIAHLLEVDPRYWRNLQPGS